MKAIIFVITAAIISVSSVSSAQTVRCRQIGDWMEAAYDLYDLCMTLSKDDESQCTQNKAAFTEAQDMYKQHCSGAHTEEELPYYN